MNENHQQARILNLKKNLKNNFISEEVAVVITQFNM
jgi:hypothetical protein